ncbi:MAG: putative C-S lyase [Chloroflexi bacterium HGW-Chloroflexi-3]|nr:MAG: putative C-S lyase [Chloroflexi bacterium HGW-Chloroflexi-3]
MQYNFDEVIPRRETESIKWNFYGKEILPFWVADMDFRSPQPVIDALEARVKHGVFGYPSENLVLKETIKERLSNLYQWNVSLEDIVFLPGVVNGFNLVIKALTQANQQVLMQPPVYHPFLLAPKNAGAQRKDAPLQMGLTRRYQIDFEQFEGVMDSNTKLFLLCNPHNPVGRVFTENELSRMADICLKKDIYICSDEIHADFIFPGHRHIPIASLSPEISQKTITLMAPSKTFNIAGLGFSFAVAQNPELRKKLIQARAGIVPEVNLLGYTAALAAYQHGDEWLSQLLVYLEGNYRALVDYLQENIPDIKITPIEGTYLAWLDCRDLEIDRSPFEFFLQNAGIAFNDGKIFGTGGEGFVRFNFGCPRSMMIEGLERMKQALENVNQKT